MLVFGLTCDDTEPKTSASVADSAVENLKDRLRKTIVGEPQDPYRRDYRRRPEPTNPDDMEP